MSRENYSSEPEEFIASLKEKLEEKDEEIRELQQQIELLKGLKEEYLNNWSKLKQRLESPEIVEKIWDSVVLNKRSKYWDDGVDSEEFKNDVKLILNGD